MVDQNISCSRKLVISPKISHFCCLTFPLPRFLTSSIYDVIHLSVSKDVEHENHVLGSHKQVVAIRQDFSLVLLDSKYLKLSHSTLQSLGRSV